MDRNSPLLPSEFPADFQFDLPPISLPPSFFDSGTDCDLSACWDPDSQSSLDLSSPQRCSDESSSSQQQEVSKALPDFPADFELMPPLVSCSPMISVSNSSEVDHDPQLDVAVPMESEETDVAKSSCISKPAAQQQHAQQQHQQPTVRHHQRARGPTERMMEITLDELSQYFNMPIQEASRMLNVGLTVLKKRCREFGIPRWPHRKLKSLQSLIQNIQELSKDSDKRKQFMDAVKELENQKKSMEVCPGIELSERTKRLRQACFKQNYKQRRQALAKLEADNS